MSYNRELIYHDIDMFGNTIYNIKFPVFKEHPSFKKEGSYYFNIEDNLLYVYSNNEWSPVSKEIEVDNDTLVLNENNQISISGSIIEKIEKIPNNDNIVVSVNNIKADSEGNVVIEVGVLESIYQQDIGNINTQIDNTNTKVSNNETEISSLNVLINDLSLRVAALENPE